MIFNGMNLAIYIQSNKARIRKLRKALKGVSINTSYTTPKEWSANSIRSWFGNDELSRVLKDILLLCIDDSYSNFEENRYCKKYVRNRSGFDYLCCVVDNKLSLLFDDFLSLDDKEKIRINAKNYSNQYDLELIKSVMEREHYSELKKRTFNMKVIGYREYHPIQNMKKRARAVLLESYGLKYDYDIESAAPSLLYQHAIRSDLGTKLKSIDLLVSDPTLYRYRVWQELNCQVDCVNKEAKLSVPRFTMSEVKKIITALFCGARICYVGEEFNRYAISNMLDNNRYKLMAVKFNDLLVDLRKDIRLMWSAIKQVETHRVNAATGKALPLTSKQKWSIYFRLECEVMKAVKNCLESHGVKYLTIHDGMQTDKEVDTQWLSEKVFLSTGYRVNFSTNVDDDSDDEIILDHDYTDETMVESVELDALFSVEDREELQLVGYTDTLQEKKACFKTGFFKSRSG